MTTDRELLELAAKANGFQVKGWIGDRLSFFDPILNSAEYEWDPLTDDGDALRLAVKLDINLYNPGSHPAALHRTEEASTFYESGCARRSIVLAAAAIGRAMIQHRCQYCEDKLCGGTGRFTQYGQDRPCDGIPF